MVDQAAIDKLLEWLKTKGAPEAPVEVKFLNESEGYGIVAKEALLKGQSTLRIPFHLTMSIESAMQTDLAPVLRKHVDMPPDEMLALHLMHEQSKGDQSFYGPFIQTMPQEFDLPIFWSEEELQELQNTNVLLLTNMMNKQIAQDFDTLYKPLRDEFPDVFGPYEEFTLNKYKWALAVIWSRAFGIGKGEVYVRVLCPLMDMFNHNVHLENPLDDFVSMNEETEMLEHRLIDNAKAQEKLEISYGRYSNAKLLYSYGFVVPGNQVKGVDFWMKVAPTDPNVNVKQSVLDKHESTANQTYDFEGTLHVDDIDERLLATLRVILTNEQEVNDCESAFEKSIITARNEQAVYQNLQALCIKRLQNFPTTTEEDQQAMEEAEASGNRRKAMAVLVRAEDKQVLVGAANLLTEWNQALVNDPTTYPPKSTRER